MNAQYNYTNAMVRNILNTKHDTLHNSIDSAITFLQKEPGGATPFEQAQIATFQAATGNITGALQTIDTLKKRGDTTYNLYCRYLPIIMTLQKAPNHLFALKNSDTALALVKKLAADTFQYGCGNARALLTFVLGNLYAHPVYRIPDNKNKLEEVIQPQNIIPDLNAQHNSPYFKIYPNPATRQVIFDYNLPENNKEPIITIYTLMGTIAAQWILPAASGTITENVTSLSSGCYFYSIEINNSVLQRGKLIITR